MRLSDVRGSFTINITASADDKWRNVPVSVVDLMPLLAPIC